MNEILQMLTGAKAFLLVILAFFTPSGAEIAIITPTSTLPVAVWQATVSEVESIERGLIIASSSPKSEPTGQNNEPFFIPEVKIITIPVQIVQESTIPTIGTPAPEPVIQSPHMEPTLDFEVKKLSDIPDANGKVPFLLKATYTADETAPFSLLVSGNPNEIDSGDTSLVGGFMKKEGNVWTYEKGLSFASTTQFTFKAGNLSQTK